MFKNLLTYYILFLNDIWLNGLPDQIYFVTILLLLSLVVYLFIRTRKTDDSFALTSFEQNIYLHSIATKSEHSIAILDTDDRVKFANEHFLELFSLRAKNIEGKIIDDTPLPMSVQKRLTLNRNGEIKFMKDGNELVRHVNIHSITDDHGRLLGRLLIIKSQEKKNDNTFSEQLKKLDDLSHDINTPLNVISGYSEILKDDDNLTEDQKEKLLVISKKSHELQRVINDLLHGESDKLIVEGGDSGSRGKVNKVMIVDDVSFNRTLLKIMLERNDIKICEAANGREAIEEMQKCKPDLICMDISMPVMDGIEAFDYIRSLNNEFSKIPIIAVTANSRKNNKDRLLKKGFDGFLQKPFRENELLEMVHKVKK